MESDSRKAPAPRIKRATGRPDNAGKSLRATVTEIDQEILRLLLRRSNLLQRMKSQGRLDPREEKLIREHWQKAVARVSRDADLSGPFFLLMQKLKFLPKPVSDQTNPEVAEKRSAFNLAPSHKPVKVDLRAPLCDWSTCAWLFMAAASGQPLRLDPCLQNDRQLDFMQALVQMGAAISREDGAMQARQFSPMGRPDRIVYVGNSELAFYFALAYYLGHPGRVKFTGGAVLKLADLSSLRHFLPVLHARMVNLVPGADGLPARVECAGILPPSVTVIMDLPAQFVEALILSAPFYAHPLTVDLAQRVDRNVILAHVLPILTECGVTYSVENTALHIQPAALALPAAPQLPLDAELAAFLLAFTAPLSGTVKLHGKLADWPELEKLWTLCRQAGWKITNSGIEATLAAPLAAFDAKAEEGLPDWALPLQIALACCATLNGGVGKIAPQWLDEPTYSDFLHVAGITSDAVGELKTEERSPDLVWNAPSPALALAFAVAACARNGNYGWSLGNPAVIMELWPPFWAFYNTLPEPELKKNQPQPVEEPKQRRRIRTDSFAELPEVNDNE